MTTLNDLIAKAKSLKMDDVDLYSSGIVSALGFDPYDVNPAKGQTSLKSAFATSWLCTDRIVGLRLYFLDGEFVATGSRPARKCDEKFSWASEEAFLKVRKYVEGFIEYPWPAFDILGPDDFGRPLDDGFHVRYWSQVTREHQTSYEGKPFEVLEVPDPIVPKSIVIRQDGIPKKVDVDEIDIDYFPGYEPADKE